MKKYHSWGVYIALGFFWPPLHTLAQTAPNSHFSPPARTSWQAAERGTTHTRWEAVTLRTNSVTGKVHARTNSYTQLGAGLNVGRPDGSFVPANPSFELRPGLAVATGTVHKVELSADIWLGDGIKVTKEDGQTLVFQPLGLDYFDPVDGRSVLLDAVTNAVGWLTASNEIIYSNCFTRIKASIRIRNTPAGLTHDVLLHERPPDPTTLGLSAEARLEMLTEQLHGAAPQAQARFIRRETNPQKLATMVAPDFLDAELDYGGMRMGNGKAFSTTRRTNGLGRLPQSVGKASEVIQQRRILIESIEHKEARPSLEQLPLNTNTLNLQAAAVMPDPKIGRLAYFDRQLPPVVDSVPGTDRASRRASIQRARTSDTAANASVGQSPLASAAMRDESPSFVLDYELVNTSGIINYTFKANTTYLIDNVPVYGTTVLEGGAVLKIYWDGLFFQYGATLSCDTTNYLPAVVTSWEDDTVGEIISGSSGTPYRAAFGFDFMDDEEINLSHVRFKHLDYAVVTHDAVTINARHLQIMDAMVGFNMLNSTTLNVFNALAVNCDWFYAGGLITFRGEHLTAHHGTTFGYASTTGSTALLRNCLFVDFNYAYNWLGNVTVDQVLTPDEEDAQFVTAGGGQHYLRLDSTYRGIGTTNIDATLRKDLAEMTTYAPQPLSGTITTTETLLPDLPRDVSTLGYHYPAIDYLADAAVLQNGSLTLRGGVVVAGTFGPNNTSQAITLAPGKLTSIGTPARLNRILRANQVQENVATRGWGIIATGDEDTFKPELTLRFTEVSSLAGESQLIYMGNVFGTFESSHSQFINSDITVSLYGGSPQVLGFTNNLFRFVNVSLLGSSPAKVFAYNNTFAPAGSVHFLDANNNTSWLIKDNLFDHVLLTHSGQPMTAAKNAYVAMPNRLPGDTQIASLSSFAYASGPLGRFYHQGTSLVDQGSRNATSAGLSRFTTRVDQTTEANTLVDVGFHYRVDSEAASSCPSSIDVMLAMDVSGSLEQAQLDAEKQAAQTFLSDLNANRGDRAGLVTFCGCPRDTNVLVNPPASISTRIDTLNINETCSGTTFHPPLIVASNYLRNVQFSTPLPGAKQVIVLMTDGQPGHIETDLNVVCTAYDQTLADGNANDPEVNRARGQRAATNIKVQDIRLITIGFSAAATDQANLRNMASPGDAYFTSATGNALAGELEDIFASIASDLGSCHTEANVPPSLTILSNAVYSGGSGVPVTVAELIDPDSLDFDRGELNVSILPGTGNVFQPGDSLGLSTTSGFGVTGADTITYYGQAIGTIVPAGNPNTTPQIHSLKFRFNSAASRSIVGKLVNSVTYRSTAAHPPIGIRSVKLSVSDGDGGVSPDYVVPVTVLVFANAAPIVSAGPDKSAPLPTGVPSPSVSVTLNGSVTDDGYPTTSLIYGWRIISGPGPVSLAGGSTLNVTANFFQPGVYTLRLEVSDTDRAGSDDAVVTITANNLPPTVDAGPDQAIEIGEYVYLPGAVTDDGLPVGALPTVTWQKQSGPGAVTFDNANAATTFATFSLPGTYVLQLSAQDGDIALPAQTDTTTITVKEAQSFHVYRDVKYVSAGVGGLRKYGHGQLTLSGISGAVRKALLYWHGPTDSGDENANACILVNGRLVVGRPLGVSANNGWNYAGDHSFANSRTYRADVTAMVGALGNGVYSFTNLIKIPDIEVNGISMIVLCDDPESANRRDIVLYEGNDSNVPFTFDLFDFEHALPATESNPVRALSQTSSGSTLVGGTFFNLGLPDYAKLVRLNENGNFDSTYKARMDTGGEVYAVQMQSDGKTLLGGNFRSIGGTPVVSLARLHTDGTRDTAFNPTTDPDGAVLAMTLQSDGNVLIGGTFTAVNGVARSKLARLTTAGTPPGALDTSFNVTASLGIVYSIVVQTDNKILVGHDSGITRLNADGTTDGGFVPPSVSSVRSVLLQPDGKILIGGRFQSVGGQTRYGLARLNAGGSFDASFNAQLDSNAKISTLVGNGTTFYAGGHFSSAGGVARTHIARFNNSGALDTTFVPPLTFNGGTDINEHPVVFAIALDASGRVTIGGIFKTIDNVECHNVARLLSNGTLDPAFRMTDAGWDVTYSGLGYTTGSAELEMHVSDGQYWVKRGEEIIVDFWHYDPTLFIDGLAAVTPVHTFPCTGLSDYQLFDGRSVANLHHDCDANLGLWDIKTFSDIGPLLSGKSSVRLTSAFVFDAAISTLYPLDVEDDALSLVVAALKLPVGAGPAAGSVLTESAPSTLPPVLRHDESVMDTFVAPKLIDVLSNDFAPDGSLLLIASVTQPTHGHVTVVHSGSAVSYVPDPVFTGTDTFEYAVLDSHGGEVKASVGVMVVGPRPSPLAPGQTVIANLAAAGTHAARRGPSFLANFYSFEALEGDQISLTLIPTGFEGHINLWSPSGQIEEIGFDTQWPPAEKTPVAHISNYTIKETGAYVVEVTSHQPGTSGDYTLNFNLTASGASLRLLTLVNGAPYASGSTIDLGPYRFNGDVSFLAPLTANVTLKNIGGITTPAGNVGAYGNGTATMVINTVPTAIEPLAVGGSSTHQITLYPPDPNGQTWHGWITAVMLVTFQGQAEYQQFNLKFFANPDSNVPQVSIASPANNSTFVTPANVSLSANVTTIFGTVEVVEWFVQFPDNRKQKIGESTASPYTLTWREPPVGAYRIYARATSKTVDPMTPQEVTRRMSESTAVAIAVANPPVNHPPVAVPDVVTVALNGEAIIDVLANDYDPDGDSLSFTILPPVAGTPFGEVESNSGGNVVYHPPNNTIGQDRFTYLLQDARGATAIGTAIVSIINMSVSIAAPSAVDESNLPVPVAVTGFSSAGSIVKLELFANSDKVGEAGQAPFSFQWTPGAFGKFTLKAVAYDSQGNRCESSPLSVVVGGNFSEVHIDNLTRDQILTEPRFQLHTTVRGQAYRLSLLRPDDGMSTDEMRLVRHLSEWITSPNYDLQFPEFDLDFSTTPNGAYEMVLTLDDDGIKSDRVPFILECGAKIGEFTMTVPDMTIPVSGLPITVLRKYSTLNTNGGVFGYGWSMLLNELNAEVDEQRTEVFTDEYPAGGATMRTGGGRNVTLTLPDGRRTTFRFSYEPGGSSCFCYHPKWTAAPGVYATLEPVDETILQFIPLQPGDEDALPPFWKRSGFPDSLETPMENFDFPALYLTTKDGTRYRLERKDQGEVELPNLEDTPLQQHTRAHGPFKLKEIRTRNGERTVISPGRIDTYGSANQLISSVLIDLDAQGRVIGIRDPRGEALGDSRRAVGYLYSQTTGNLIVVSNLTDRTKIGDAAYRLTHFSYDARPELAHHLTKIEVGPVGAKRTVLQNAYDGEGRLISSKDGASNQSAVSHDLANRRELITDPDGNLTIHEYDAHGNVVRSTDALGHITSRTFDGTNNVLSETDALGHKTIHTHDAAGNLASSTDPQGGKVSFTYDFFGNVTKMTDARQNQANPALASVINSYDPNTGSLIYTVDASDKGTTNYYNASGQLVRTTNALGATTTYDYYYVGQSGGRPGDLKSVTERAPNQTVLSQATYIYDPNGNRTNETTTRTLPSGASQSITTAFIYDDANRLIETRDPEWTSSAADLHRTRTVYNDYSQVTQTYDSLGRVTSYLYDASGNRVQTTYPTDANTPLAVSRTIYDRNNRPLYVQDRVATATPTTGTTKGHSTRTIYDVAGRVQRTERVKNVRIGLTVGANGIATTVLVPETFTLSGVTVTASDEGVISYSETTCDDAGHAIATSDSFGNRREMGYDAAGRQVSVTTFNDFGSPLVSRYTYDANGNRLTFTDALGRTTDYEYDSLNRQKVTRFPLVTGEGNRKTLLTSYDDLGRRVSATDQAGVVTKFGYDFLDRLVAVTNDWHAAPTANPFVTQYRYDEVGNQIEQTDANGQTTRYEYNKLGQRVKRRLPAHPTTTFEGFAYDAAGNVLRHTNFTGKITSMTYDVWNRLKQKIPDASLGEPTATFAYYVHGGRNTVTIGSVNSDVTTYLYDELNRLQEKQTPQGRLKYTYGASGRIGSVRTQNANGSGFNTISYAYDSQGRLSTVTDDNRNDAVTTYHYDAVGNLHDCALPNGVTAVHTYDQVNRLKNLHITKAAIVLADYTYQIGAAGQRTGVIEANNRAIVYVYDNLYRLQSETISADPSGFNGTLSYTYDNVGNRKTRSLTSATTALQNAVPPIDHTGGFDANDRLTPATGYTLDDNGNTTSSPGSTADTYDFENRLKTRNGTTTFVYDGDGNRVKKTVGGVSTYYLVDDHNPSGWPQVIAELDSPTASKPLREFVFGHTLISQSDWQTGSPGAWITRYAVQDGHGSVRQLFDTTGALVESYDFDAFGNLLAAPATPQSRHLFAGEQWDSDLGLYYNRARYLAPALGRFWTMDSYEGNSSDPVSLHKYLYCHADPIDEIDPSGHDVEFDAAKGRLVHEEFYPFALAALGVTKFKDTAIGTAVPSLAGQPGSGLRPDIIAIGNGVKKWFELKPISHKNSKLTDGTIATLTSYGALLAQAGVQPGIPQTLVPRNFRLGTIVDPADGQRLQVWLEAGDVPGLIFYYFKRGRDDDDDGHRVPRFVPYQIVLPEYNPASRAVALTGGRAAIASRSLAYAATAGIALSVAIATLNSMQGAP